MAKIKKETKKTNNKFCGAAYDDTNTVDCEGKAMPTLSLCMIVKDEEQVLARCLDSVRKAVDEIIIVDTGSTDQTKAIARKYTKALYDFKWIDDFSAARNFSFSKATMDYLLWLDADDVITPENLRALLDLKQNLSPDTDTVMMKYETAFDEDGNVTFSFYRERILRRSTAPLWRGRVHEAIEPVGKRVYADIAVTHRSIKTSYSDRNLRIYQKQIESGELLSPRDTFYYGRELYYHRQYRCSIAVLTDFLNDDSGWVENKIEACRILSVCHTALSCEAKALDDLFLSFQFAAPRAEICCEIGNIFLRQERYSQAIFWFELARTRRPAVENGGFCDLDSYGFLPCIQLCVCYDRIGNRPKAEQYNAMAGKFRPHAPAYLYNIRYFAQEAQNVSC